jgi:hypothetical protein
MTPESLSHHDAKTKNRALWDGVAPVHLESYMDSVDAILIP